MARPLALQTSLQTAETALTPAQTAAAGEAGAKHDADPASASQVVQGLLACGDCVDSRSGILTPVALDANAVLDKRGALHDRCSISMVLESTAAASQKSDSGMHSTLSEAQSSGEQGSAGAAGEPASTGTLARQPLQEFSPVHSACTSPQAHESSGMGQALHSSSENRAFLRPRHGLSAASTPGEGTSSVCTGHAEHGQRDEAGSIHSESTQSATATEGVRCGSSNAAVEGVAKAPDKCAVHGVQERRHMECTLDQMVAGFMIAGLSGMLACGLVLLASSPSVKWWG